MAENLLKIRGQLKAQWVAANKKVLDLRRKVAEAEQKAAALQRVLDAIEKAAPESVKGEEAIPVRRGSRNGMRSRIVEVLRTKGPLKPREIAEEVGASYWSVLSHLKRGPFRQQDRVGNEGRSALPWVLVEGEAGFAVTGSETEAKEG